MRHQQPKRGREPLCEAVDAMRRTRGVASKLGLSLSEAMLSGIFSPKDYADMVNLCRQCLGADACDACIQEAPGRSANAPVFCANAAMLAQAACVLHRP